MLADKMRVVQIGDLTHDLHLSIFPSLVSDCRSEPIINLSNNHPISLELVQASLGTPAVIF